MLVVAVGLGSVDYVAKDGRTVVFRTCPEERGRVIMQLGVADPVLGLKAAEVGVDPSGRQGRRCGSRRRYQQQKCSLL